MKISDIPIITEETREKLRSIIESQFLELESKTNHLFNYVNNNGIYTIKYINTYEHGKNNLIYLENGPLLMAAFNFSVKNHLRIYRLLGLENKAPKINAMRIFPNTEIPIHIDPNRGNLGREHLTYTIVTSGADGMAYASDRLGGKKLFIIPGRSNFLLCPTGIPHGAKSGSENYDILQIQIDE